MDDFALSPRVSAAGPGGIITVLAGGILLQALTMYLTSALMPGIVGTIGGQAYYAWVTTVFLVAGVAATMAVPSLLGRLGARRGYAVAAGTFAAGSALAAVAPAMEVLLVARGLQGLGGGMLSGLAFALIRATLPDDAWGRGTAIISAMFAVGTLVGPALGGAFAQVNGWRLAFGSIAVLGVVLGATALRLLPQGPRTEQGSRPPWLPLLLLTAAVGALSLASVVAGLGVWLALAGGSALIGLFIVADRAARGGVLPGIVYGPGPLKWLFLALALTTAAAASEAFTPWFGQQLFGLAPFAAGFLGAAVSAGWSAAGWLSARVAAPQRQAQLSVWGPVLTTAAMGALLGLHLVPSPPWPLVGWIVALTLAGAGVGLANPHLSVRVMASTVNAADGAKAAAAIPVASQLGQAITAALGGTVLNLALPSLDVAAARLFLLFSAVALLGLGAVLVSQRRRVPAATTKNDARTR